MSARHHAPDLGELLALAEQTATAAAILLAEEGAEQRPEVAATKSSLTDVVTEMDRRAEHLIRERILAARPGDTILGEEGGETRGTAGPGSARWIVDPLDGTVNYLYGLADWCVSIAAEVDGVVVVGGSRHPAARRDLPGRPGPGRHRPHRHRPDPRGPERPGGK